MINASLYASHGMNGLDKQQRYLIKENENIKNPSRGISVLLEPLAPLVIKVNHQEDLNKSMSQTSFYLNDTIPIHGAQNTRNGLVTPNDFNHI